MLQTVITDDNVTESHVLARPQLCEVIDSRELISRVSFYILCPAPATTGVPLQQLCLPDHYGYIGWRGEIQG
jgi:hypothetical protein